MNESLFHFMKYEDEELSNLGEQIEKRLYNDTHSVINKSRIFIEKIITKTFEKEDLNIQMHPSFIDRINKLDRTGVLTKPVVERLHWLRKEGNKASHEAEVPKVEKALKAHRFLFDIAVWYMEVYDYTFQPPEYHLPFQKDQLIDSKSINEIVNQAVKNSVGSVVEEQLNSLKLKEVSTTTNRVENYSTVEDNQDKSIKSQSSFKPLAYFREKGYEVIDKRNKGGTVWVIGTWDDRTDFFTLKKHKFYFKFSKNGSQSTNKRPAWFMLNKDYQGELDSNDEVEEIVNEEKAENLKKNLIETDQSEVTEHENRSPFGIIEIDIRMIQLSDQIAIPEYLQDIEINKVLNGQLDSLTNLLGLYKFKEINDAQLRKLYLHYQEHFFQNAINLWLLGVRFSKNLSKLVSLPEEIPSQFIQIDTNQKTKLSTIVKLYEAKKLKNVGIERINDLNMIPIQSLKWLLGDNYDDLKKLIIDNTSTLIKETEEVEAIHDLKDSDGKLLMLEGKVITLPPNVANMEIKRDQFESCQNVVIKLREKGILRFNDLPENLDLFHKNLRHVGPRALEKFWERLIEIVTEDNSVEVKNLTNEVSGEKVKFENDELIFCQSMQKALIENDINKYQSSKILVEKLKDYDTYYYCDLPYNIEDILKIKGAGYKKVKEFFKAMKEVNNIYLEDEKKKQEIEGLDDTQLIHYYLEKARHEIEQIISDEGKQNEIKLNELSVPIFYEKFKGYWRGENITLQMLGDQYSLTRERIRQISNKTLMKLEQTESRGITKLLELAKDKRFIKNDFISKETFVDYLLTEILEMRGLYYNETLNCLTTYTSADVDDLERSIRQTLKDNLEAVLFDAEDIHELVRSYSDETYLVQVMTALIFEKYTTFIEEYNRYIALANDKNDLAEIYLSQFPEGLEVYKDVEAIATDMNRLFPKRFNPDRSTASLFTNLERSYLWARGWYIHEKFVPNNDELLDDIIQQATLIVNERGILSVTRLYRDFEEELQASNIPNEYALYTMLRVKEPDNLAFIKFPKIYQSGSERKENSEIIKDYIRTQRKPVTNRELMEYFTQELGWKRFTVEFSISNDNELISCDRGLITVVNLSNQIEFSKLEKIHLDIEKYLKEQNVVHIQKFYSQHESLCRSMSINAPVHLYNVLRYYFHNQLQYFRYPYITQIGRNFDEMTNVKLIDNYILEEMAEVSKEEVADWVLNELGGSENTIHNALNGSNNLLTYSSGKFGEVIHKDVIAWNEEKETQLIAVIQKQTEKFKYNYTRPFINLDHVFYDIEIDLPELDYNILWTADLIADILKQSDKHQLLLVGSANKIIVNTALFNELTSETKFIEHLLINQPFNGSAKLTDFKKLLREIGYSYQGEILHEVEKDIEEGATPLTLLGNELVYDESRVKL